MDEPLAVTLELDGYEPMDVALTGETTEQRVALTARPDERTTQARVEPIAQPSEEPRPRRGRPSTTESESPPEPAGETPPSSGDPYERFEF